MKTGGGGSIVNMSSVAAFGLPFAAAYSASKGSVAALTNSVAIHCRSAGYRIRCNSIHPDGVLTPMVLPMLGNPDPKAVGYDTDPTTRFCDPSDVANLVLFLISDESRFISGAQIRITNAY
jgi:3(or 17)beta-hydroxysteroid dehydrogenase